MQFNLANMLKHVLEKTLLFRNTVQTQILIHVRALTPMNTRTYILPL
jgi:hypothetical protein